jgi:three-Cys-motif partner protein
MEDLIGKWSEEKLELLRKYLSGYVTVLRNQASKGIRGFEYIDGFAGTGKPKSKDKERYIEGSPRVALGLPTPFTKYHFIEMSDWRRARLEALKQEFTGLDIEIYPGDCNEVIRSLIVPTLPYSSYKRAIAFLDPFGLALEWETLKAIANTKTIEVFINIPIMDINRNIRRQDKDQIPEESRERITRFWGPGWDTDFFEEKVDLFGESRIDLKPQSAKQVGNLYRKRLQQVFPFCTVPVVLRNSTNAPLYGLVFGGHNKTGLRIAEDIFQKFEKMG